jgi:CheY-like chemotaxis protein
VRVYSEVGEGTTVKIYLPRDAAEEARDDDRTTIFRKEHALGAETILVVEDDEALRALSVETLTELGYRTLQAGDGPAALEVLRGEENVDLMFSDVVMPGGLNGRQLAAEAVRIRPNLKVLFTTGYTRNAIVHHGRLDAGVELIGKPFSLGGLGRKIRDVLDKPPADPAKDEV